MSKKNDNGGLDLKSGRLFPFQFQLLGIILLIMTPTLLIPVPWLSPFTLLMGLFILTSWEGTEFRKEPAEYREYYQLFWMKFGKWSALEPVEKLYLKSASTSQYIYTRVTTGSQIKSKEFNGYLKFENGEKIHLVKGKKKEKILGRLTKLSTYLQVKLEEYD